MSDEDPPLKIEEKWAEYRMEQLSDEAERIAQEKERLKEQKND
ncbi:hypothetical protein [Halomonas sp.]